MADFAFRSMVRFGRAKGIGHLQNIIFGNIDKTVDDDGRLIISTTINSETVQWSTMGTGITIQDVMVLAERALEYIEGNDEDTVDSLLAGKIEDNVVVRIPNFMV